ncbi:MAG: DUF177 domain-containing protein [Eubacteriales bacterium]|nr:DUF177 domain-containing protein [Eubacteriales bacterium]
MLYQDDKFYAEGTSEFEKKLECSRCLQETKINQQISFKDLYLKNKEDLEMYENDFPGNIFFVEKGNLDLADSIAAALEEQKVDSALCSENCEGLCPQCGTNLNIAKCKCKDDKIDPRLEALKNFKI